MEKERSKAKNRGSQNVSKEKHRVRARESKSKVAKTQLWLVGQGNERMAENKKMSNSNAQVEQENADENQNGTVVYAAVSGTAAPATGNEGLSPIKENETNYQDQIDTEPQELRQNAISTGNPNVPNESAMLQLEAQTAETEWTEESTPLIKKSNTTDEEIADFNRNYTVKTSANTSYAISEIHLNESDLGTNIPTPSGMSDQRIDGTQRVEGLDLLSSSSKSLISDDKRTSSLIADGIKLGKIPQKVVQKANEMYHILAQESLKRMDYQNSISKEEAPDVTSQDGARKVKVVLEGDIDKMFFLNSSLSVSEAKAVLTKMSGISKRIALRANGRILSETELLENVGDITMELAVEESDDNLRNVQSARSKVIQVKILQEDGTWKYSKVAVMNFGSRKQYMGGYRDKRTGQVYYHVICQTEPKNRPVKELKTREVQANLFTADRAINTPQVGMTQTSTETYPQGKIVTARPYIPYNEAHKTMTPLGAVQIIQRAWRKFIFRRFVSKHFQKLAASLKEKTEEESCSVQTVQKRRLQAMTAAIYPSFRSHFSDFLMYLNIWAKNEAGRLASTKTGVARKAAMYQLLIQEQQMFFTVETNRLKAVEENLRKQDIMFLEGTARSRARVYEKGNVTLVDDLNIQKAVVFKEIFASYSRTDTKPTERLEILHWVRETLLLEFSINNPDVNDLLEILDREIDLITIGFPNAQMFYLRKRFETKFLHLVRDPEVNPQAKYFRKSHITEKKYAIHRCKFCNKNLPSSLMFSHIRMEKFRICLSCVQLEQNGATDQLNLAPFKRMLHAMRAKELENNCLSAIPFLVQPLGAYFLVNVIWNGKSILSGITDLSQLRMARWLPDQDWSVWNMILLTEKEASEHDCIPDPLTHYSEELILQVRTRNILGRMNFMYLVDIDNDFKFDRISVGQLPRDHLLYTNRHHARYAPGNAVPEFFTTITERNNGDHKGT